MKIQITKQEILKILSERFGVTVSEFSVDNGVAQTLKNFIALHPLYMSSGKISAIKAIRQLGLDNKWYDGTIMGLADAKWAIEHFNELLTFVDKNNRLPEPGFAYEGLK